MYGPGFPIIFMAPDEVKRYVNQERVGRARIDWKHKNCVDLIILIAAKNECQLLQLIRLFAAVARVTSYLKVRSRSLTLLTLLTASWLSQ